MNAHRIKAALIRLDLLQFTKGILASLSTHCEIVLVIEMPLKFVKNWTLKLKQLLANNTPKEKWLLVFNFAYISLKLSGTNSLDKSFRPTFHTVLSGLALIDYFVLSAENFYRFRHDIWTAMQPICVLAIIIPVGHKF